MKKSAVGRALPAGEGHTLATAGSDLIRLANLLGSACASPETKYPAIPECRRMISSVVLLREKALGHDFQQVNVHPNGDQQNAA
jgi:hypothetical protein